MAQAPTTHAAKARIVMAAPAKADASSCAAAPAAAAKRARPMSMGFQRPRSGFISKRRYAVSDTAKGMRAEGELLPDARCQPPVVSPRVNLVCPDALLECRLAAWRFQIP